MMPGTFRFVPYTPEKVNWSGSVVPIGAVRRAK
jgi:hypothetical protein